MENLEFLLDENLIYVDAVCNLEIEKNAVKFTASRPTLDQTSIVISCESLHWKVFFTLPQSYAFNLVRLEIQIGEHNNFIAPDKDFKGSSVEMKSLKHVDMDRDLFLQLNDRIINFTTDKLETLILQKPGFSYSYKPAKKDITSVIALLTRQTNLKVLHLCGNFSSFFDKPLMFKTQLTDLCLGENNSRTMLNEEQQNNLFDFLMAQKCIEGQKFYFDVKMPSMKMRLHKMKFLDLPIESQKITVRNNIFAHDCYKSLEFGKYDHQPNEITRNLEIHIFDDPTTVMTFIGYKFPNLLSLKIVMELNEYEKVVLSGLKPLKHLQTLEIEYTATTKRDHGLSKRCNCKDCRNHSDHKKEVILFNKQLELKKLKKFVFIDHSDNNYDDYCDESSCAKHLNELKKFLAANKTIEDLTLKFDGDWVKEYWSISNVLTCLIDVLKLAFEKFKDWKSIKTTWFIDPTKEDIKSSLKQFAYEFQVDPTLMKKHSKYTEINEIVFTKHASMEN